MDGTRAGTRPFDIEAIRREMADDFDEELEMELEDERLERLVSEIDASPRPPAWTGESISVSCFGSNTSWFVCRIGSRPRSSAWS